MTLPTVTRLVRLMVAHQGRYPNTHARLGIEELVRIGFSVNASRVAMHALRDKPLTQFKISAYEKPDNLAVLF